MERWCDIEDFPGYAVSDYGNICATRSGRILSLGVTQWGLVQVGLMRDGVQCHRSVPLLVAKAFLPEHPDTFDTPINLDGNRRNNHVDNLAWRPRWFAIKYNQQFKHQYNNAILSPIVDLKTGDIYNDSTECARQQGLLEQDLVYAIINRTYVWPTYQEFGILEY